MKTRRYDQKRYGEVKDVELAPKFYSAEIAAESSEPCVFVPLTRGFLRGGDSALWSCHLLEPYMLSRDREPAKGEPGDTFLLYEPSQPGLQGLLVMAAREKLPIFLACKGKEKRMHRGLGRFAEMWTWEAQCGTIPQSIAPVGAFLLPEPAPAPVKEQGEADDIPF
jgi:hypothetical protein